MQWLESVEWWALFVGALLSLVYFAGYVAWAVREKRRGAF
jgi:hypothetical protein